MTLLIAILLIVGFEMNPLWIIFASFLWLWHLSYHIS